MTSVRSFVSNFVMMFFISVLLALFLALFIVMYSFLLPVCLSLFRYVVISLCVLSVFDVLNSFL